MNEDIIFPLPKNPGLGETEAVDDERTSEPEIMDEDMGTEPSVPAEEVQENQESN